MKTQTKADIGEMVKQAMLLSGLKTEKEVIEQALREFLSYRTSEDNRTPEEIRRANQAWMELEGKIEFADGYDYKATRSMR
jgi:Arc/MetJ family transcription regulator